MPIAAAPNSNTYLQQSNQRILVSWDLVSGATSYAIQRSTDGVTFSALGTSSVNSYLDSTPTVGTTYYYQVASVNGSGTSAYTTTSPTSIVATLPGIMSLGEIRLRAQQRADRVNSNFVTMPEWNYYIDQSAYELYDLLITVFEDYYIAPRLLLSTNGTSTNYALPDGKLYTAAPAFYKLYGVDLGLDGSTNAWVTLKKFNFIQRNKYVFPQITSNYLGILNLQYRVVGSNLMLIPTPASSQTIGIWYFPRLTALLQDTDMLDGISGWTEYVIIDAAIKALRKEESDTSELMAEKQAMLIRIQDSAQNRDVGMGDCISDSRSAADLYGNNGLGGWGGGAWGGY